MIEIALSQLNNIINSIEDCNRLIPAFIENNNNSIALVEKNKQHKDIIIATREFYRKAIDKFYEISIVDLKNRLNSAVNYIFHDKNYELDIVLSDKRGKSAQLILKDIDGNEVSLKDGVGQGIRTVISFILQTYYLASKNSKILMLDEAYHNISEEYIYKFLEFMKKFAIENDFKIIIISHDHRILAEANKQFIIVDGKLTDAK